MESNQRSEFDGSAAHKHLVRSERGTRIISVLCNTLLYTSQSEFDGFAAHKHLVHSERGTRIIAVLWGTQQTIKRKQNKKTFK